MTNAVEDYTGPLPNGWTGGQATVKWWRGQWVHLYRLRKPCAQCNEQMQIDVTRAALEGKAKNAGLHLKRCAKCRAASKALNTVSRPTVPGQTIEPADSNAEIEQLRTANATMKEELSGLYTQNRELRERLSKYEINDVTLEDALVQFRTDKSLTKKMPWEH